ncbi:cation diffusion facilitator family transporter [Martelella limonii]|uniref:cation diffusion facilitator family transporter n=1 Tax=Martelella limonii TaxID=1647649 RepID=UPI00158050C5|nr:cation diffusion facilitator family transporter [Martelella limonii]
MAHGNTDGQAGHRHGPHDGHNDDHDDHHDHHDDHGHHHGEGHHSHAPKVSRNNERVVLIGLTLTAGFMVAEFIGGWLSGSLALIADAAHMLTDTAALGLAWAAFRFGRMGSDEKRTFGYMRFEVLAGFVNALTLFLLTIWIAYEAFQRLATPEPVLAGPMLVVAILGLLVNIGIFLLLMRGDRDHVTIKGAMLHVIGDLLGSVGAIAAALIIYFTGWTPIDPILSVVMAALILRAAWALLKSAAHILMEGTPSNIEIEALRRYVLDEVPDISDVTHVHVWSITSGRPAATMEISLGEGASAETAAERVKAVLARQYDIRHATVEINWKQKSADCPLEGQA